MQDSIQLADVFEELARRERLRMVWVAFFDYRMNADEIAEKTLLSAEFVDSLLDEVFDAQSEGKDLGQRDGSDHILWWVAGILSSEDLMRYAHRDYYFKARAGELLDRGLISESDYYFCLSVDVRG